MKAIWRFILDCLEALAADDRNIDQKVRDHQDAQQRWYSFLGSGRK